MALSPTSDTLLDLDGYGLRVTGFRFQLLDVHKTEIGWLDEVQHGVATIRHDSGQEIMRSVQRLVVEPTEADSIDVSGDRLRIWCDLSNGAEFAIFTGLFIDAPRVGRPGWRPMVAALADLNWEISWPFKRTHGLPGGTNVGTGLAQLALLAPSLNGIVVEPHSDYIPSPQFYGPDDSLLSSINKIGSKFGYYNLARDGMGIAHMRRVIDPDAATPELDYDEHPRMYSDDTLAANDLLASPNEIAVVDGSGQPIPTYGAFDLPGSHPMSTLNRGFAQPKVVDVQGVGDASADAAALYAAISESRPFEFRDFDGPPDPRHDLFNVITLEQKAWVERQWALEMFEGGRHGHYVTRPVAA